MKRFILSALFIFSVLLTFAQVSVRGYTKKNGTYVAPYTRSSPDKNPYNNYSYPGNTNPYTGKVATGNPDTYLNNYYNRSTNSSTTAASTNSSSVKYKIYEPSYIKSGSYLRSFFKGETFTVYDVYDFYNNYTGYLTLFNDRTAKLYNKDKQLIFAYSNFDFPLTPVNNISTATSTAQPTQTSTSSYQNYAYSNNTTPVSTYSGSSSNTSTDHSMNVLLAEKKYLKDAKGNYTGEYLLLKDEDDTRKKYALYDVNDFERGTLVVYANGQRILFNNSGKVVARSGTKKK